MGSTMKVIEYQTPSNAIRHGLLVATGRKWTQLILIEHPIRVTRIPNTELSSVTEMNYRLGRAKRIVKDMVKAYYGTIRNAPKSVRKVL